MTARRAHSRAIVLAVCVPFVASCFARPIAEEPAPRRPVPRPAPERPPEPLPADPTPRAPSAGSGVLVRVALAAPRTAVPLGATGAWRLLDRQGGVLVRARVGESWRLERRGTRLRAVRNDGSVTPWQAAGVTQYADDGELVRFGARAYRGALAHVASDTGIVVVNVLPLEEYLRGVVPVEIGERSPGERPAVEAQAVAARSYTVRRLLAARDGNGRSVDFDLVATVGDQVYGGQTAERPLSDAAVGSTTGLVLLYADRVVDAPFSSACGGETAAAEDVWRGGSQPHLRRVSDRIPGSDRYYCDIAPRFAWTRTLAAAELDAVVRRYLAAYAPVQHGNPGRVGDVAVERRSEGGRVESLVVRTDRGRYALRGNDARSVLRTSGGELLNSSYFSVTIERSGGRLVRVVLQGNGFGHGVGMCQWGAIGRARLGQDFRTILRTYFPGTRVGPIPQGLLTS